MKEDSKTGCYPFMAEPFHCDAASRLFMGHLGNHLINAADFHSNDRGFGMHYLNTIHKTWVLSRLSVEMAEMPRAYDRFTVETWVESAMRFFTNRNFKIASSKDDGPVYGYGRSVWAMIDTETRQPADLFSINDGAMMRYVEPDKECPMGKPSRVRIGEGARLVRTLATAYSDIDMNGHVNSVKYIEHALDLWDTAWHREHPVRRLDVAYVAEAHLGDELGFFLEEQNGEKGSGENGRAFAVRIAKRSAADGEFVETCRCGVAFG